MPISSGAGGKPNSYFNPANALGRRPSVTSIGYGGPQQPQQQQQQPGYYYGGYAGGSVSARSVQIAEVPDSATRNGGRSCCPCPSRSRPEMRLPQMPRSKLATSGNAISRRGCCIFLLGLLALAIVAGVVAGLYFLGQEITGTRLSRAAFYLIPGRRTGDLMWVVYGRTQECQPSTTSTASTTTTTATTPTTDPNVTTSSTVTTTVVTTTLIPCDSTTFSYAQVTLGAGGWPRPAAAAVAAMAAAAMAAG